MPLKKKPNKSFFFTIKILFPSKFFLKIFLKKLKKKNNFNKISFQFLKKKKKQFVFLKSPHVNKKAKEHFCFFKYSLIFKINCGLNNLLQILKIFPLFMNFYILYFNTILFKKFKKKVKIFEFLKKKSNTISLIK